MNQIECCVLQVDEGGTERIGEVTDAMEAARWNPGHPQEVRVGLLCLFNLLKENNKGTIIYMMFLFSLILVVEALEVGDSANC